MTFLLRLLPPAGLIAALCATGLHSESVTRGATSTHQDEWQPQSGFSEQVSVGYVLVPVVARSQEGYVEGLDEEDFTLTVDGQAVAIESFDVGASAPVSIMFLQDLSGSMANGPKLRLSRVSIDRILATARSGDQFALATFANSGLTLRQPFTSEVAPIEEDMGTWQPYGVTALHDAVWGLPDLTRGFQSAKRAAILITDGADNASRIDPTTARDRVRQAELPVYILGLATGDPAAVDRQGNKMHRYADVLNLLAHLSGGGYFWISTANDAMEAVDRISSDLRHQYVLGFSVAASGDFGYRKIQVVTRRRNVSLSFRRGYEGLPPQLAPQPPM